MGFDFGNALNKFASGLAGGIGDGIGKVAGKIADWVPGPQQYRRRKLREIQQKMVALQSKRPFDELAYSKLLEQRDKLESESENHGN